MYTKPQIITVVVCLISGVSVLLSWAFNFSILPTPHVVMNPLTAIEFILCGIAIVASQTIRRWLGVIVFLIASIKLISFTGFDLGIDRILFSEKLNQVGLHPNRMAPLTTINFIFIGLAFIYFNVGTLGSKYPLSNFLIIIPSLISLTGAVGYIYSTLGLAQVGNYIPIAFNTTITFLTLCFGIVLHHGETGILGVFQKKTPSAIVGRRLLPYVILLPILLGWISTLGERKNLMQPEYGVAIMAIGWAVIGTGILWGAIYIINNLEETLHVTLKRESDNKLNRMKRFFPPSIAEMIVSGEIEDPFKWSRKDITVIFIDIRGFTKFSEHSAPEDVMRMLQVYYSTVAKIVQKHNGTIGHLAGDGVMVFFNAPITVDNPQAKAVQMSLEIRQELLALWSKNHYTDLELDFGTGIASGDTTIGGIGQEGFWDYTVIGTTTNIASRLCSAAKDGQILVSQRFLGSLKSPIETESIGSLELKGIQRPVSVFNIKSMKPPTS